MPPQLRDFAALRRGRGKLDCRATQGGARRPEPVSIETDPVQSALIRIGTRGSPLALAQARETAERLRAAHGLGEEAIEIVVIRTSGDRIQDRTLTEAGGKGLFTKEIEEALIDRRIDLAVHSSKDMPTVLPRGLTLAAFLPREDVRDAFVSLRARSLAELPAGALVGTASLRRQALVLKARPDLRVVPLRGNVETRLGKLEGGTVDATLLAAAGLKRLGKIGRATALLSAEEFLPAVGQGAICIETRADDAHVRSLVAPLNDAATATALACERAFLAALDGSCRTPIAGYARLLGGRLVFDGMIVTPDGRTAHAARRAGAPDEAAAMGTDAGAELKGRGGPAFFAR